MTNFSPTFFRRLADLCASRYQPTLVRHSAFAVAIVIAGATASSAEIPSSIRKHDAASVEGSRVPGPDGHTHLRIRTAARAFDLVLEPSPVVAAGAQTIVVDDDGEHRQPSESLVYRGHLADDPDSEVHVAIAGSSAVGSVTTAGETWLFEPLRRYEHGARAEDTIVYRKSDIDVSADPGTCAAESAPIAALGALQDGGAAGVAAESAVTDTMGLVELTLVADHAFYAAHGADTSAYMQSIVDQVASFYTTSIGVTVSIVQTVIYQSAGTEPLSSSTASGTLLSSLAEARESHPATLGAGDITHLFTGRDLDQNVIGIAYLGTVCDSFYAASIAQDFNTNLHLMTLLTGHELGHSLGAYHDGQSGSPCVSTPIGWVMWPVVYSSLTEAFSACSQASIDPVVQLASCIGDAIPTNCGNGTLNSGEQCDDGNNSNGDCCRADCKFDAAGSLCAADVNACTNDVCNGSGSCTHPNNSASCDDGDACSADGQCSAGVCLDSTDYAPLYSPRFKAHLRGGGEDALVFSAYVDAGLASRPTQTGAAVRFLDSAGGLLHESFAAASGWVDRKDAGTTFLFAPADSALAATSGGIAAMVVRFKPAASLAKIRLRLKDTDLSFLDGRDSVDMQILIGDAVTGDCGTTMNLACEVSAGLLACS